jgi:MFS family permease
MIKNKGWIVTFAGVGINLALGILFTWSIIKEAIKKSIEQGGTGSFAWSLENLNDPYSLCCLVFSFSMILGGRCQDKFGPKLTATMGGIFLGSGLIIISQSVVYWIWLLGFGVLAGIGIGFCFSSGTPPAIKWFPSSKTGMIVGIVVSGFGIAGAYIAPLTNYLLGIWSLSNTILFFGISFIILIPLLSFLLIEPPKDYYVEEIETSSGELNKIHLNFRPGQVLKSQLFLIVWILFFIGAGAGLMVISSISEMAKKNLGDQSFFTVVSLAIGNAGGRITAGMLSDKIGRRLTLMIMLIFQSVLMFASIFLFENENSHTLIILFISLLIGFNYGTNMSLFPSLTKDLWGIENFGINYGFLFTAWGLGGFLMSKISQVLFTASKTYTSSFVIAGILLVFAASLTFILRDKMHVHNIARKNYK